MLADATSDQMDTLETPSSGGVTHISETGDEDVRTFIYYVKIIKIIIMSN